MKLTFITTNKHKVEEVQAVLKDYDVKIEQVIIDYPEDKKKRWLKLPEKAQKI